MLRTKLHRPPITKEHVYRDHLIEFLNSNQYKPFTLVSAPAGFGKSMLISSWLEKCNGSYAWISLSEDENDLRLFLECIDKSIKKINPDALEDFSKLLNIVELPSTSVISETLINELDDIDEDFILVLDDYHLLHNNQINELVDQLLRYPPQNMHLAILTRRDPALNLSSLRAHSRMNEIRMPELCFTKKEIAILFKHLKNTDLRDETIDSLYNKTEGWITGLQLASLTVGDLQDANHVLINLEGNVHLIADFMVKEVLQKQPIDMQIHLLKTASLNRFSNELVDHLSLNVNSDEEPKTTGQEFIDWLLKTNLFIISLDDKNKWFRYHHLFQDLLQNQLNRKYSQTDIQVIHLKAMEWFKQNHFPNEAIRHAIAAGNMQAAVNIVEQYGHELIEEEKIVELEHILGLLPDEVIQQKPILLIFEAWVARFKVDIPKITILLGHAEKLLNAKPENKEPDNIAWGYLNSIRSYERYAMLDSEQAKICSQNAIDQIPNKYGYMKSFATVVNSAVHQMQGEYLKAISIMNAGLNNSSLQGTYMQGIMLHSMAKICMMEADSITQLKFAERLRNIKGDDGNLINQYWGQFDRGCSYYLLNEINDSIQNLQSFHRNLGFIYPDIISDSAAILSLSYLAMNQIQEANDIANILDDYAKKTENIRLQQISQALIAEVALRQGNIAIASRWANNFNPRKLSAHYFFYLPELTYVKTLLAGNKKEDFKKAADVLINLENFSRNTFNYLILIPVLALQGIIIENEEDNQAAFSKLEEAFSLAKTRGCIRLFIDLIPGLENVLNRMVENNIEADYIQILREARPLNMKGKTPIKKQFDSPESLSKKIDQLSFREIDVLKHLAKGLRNKEIAEKLFITTDTVKKHLRSVFSKLNVHSRIHAVNKAIELGIIEKN